MKAGTIFASTLLVGGLALIGWGAYDSTKAKSPPGVALQFGGVDDARADEILHTLEANGRVPFMEWRGEAMIVTWVPNDEKAVALVASRYGQHVTQSHTYL